MQVAVDGHAVDDDQKFAGVALHMLRVHEYRGRVLACHPRKQIGHEALLFHRKVVVGLHPAFILVRRLQLDVREEALAGILPIFCDRLEHDGNGAAIDDGLERAVEQLELRLWIADPPLRQEYIPIFMKFSKSSGNITSQQTAKVAVMTTSIAGSKRLMRRR